MMDRDGGDGELLRKFEQFAEHQRHAIDVWQRQVDDLMFFNRLGDVAEIELVSFTGPPPRKTPNPTRRGAGTRPVLRAYVFIPRDLDRNTNHPLIVQVHGGIHANFGTGAANVVRELVTQGYT